MKMKNRTIYYCDFCKKKSMRIDTMEKHEKVCTLNPDRECGLCGNKERVNKENMKYLKDNDIKQQLQKDGSYNIIGFDKLKEAVKNVRYKNDCPICLFAILRQGLSRGGFSHVSYNLEEEMKKYWKKEEIKYDERW